MVWFRAWLETRSRVAFTIVWLAFFIGVLAMPGRNSAGAGREFSVLLTMLSFTWVFVPVWLAGSGIRTQAGFGRGATRGLHGSTYFTLSLPVTRTRLFLARAAIGLIETEVIVIVMGVAIWMLMPVVRTNVSAVAGLQHLLVVSLCGLTFYGLSTLTATLLDDVLHMWSSTLVIMALWAPPVRRLLPAAFDVFQPLTDASPLVTHTLPWTAMAAAATAGAVLMLAALKVVHTQEF